MELLLAQLQDLTDEASVWVKEGKVQLGSILHSLSDINRLEEAENSTHFDHHHLHNYVSGFDRVDGELLPDDICEESDLVATIWGEAGELL